MQSITNYLSYSWEFSKKKKVQPTIFFDLDKMNLKLHAQLRHYFVAFLFFWMSDIFILWIIIHFYVLARLSVVKDFEK